MTSEYEARGSLAQLVTWRALERPEFPFLYVEGSEAWTMGGLARSAFDLSVTLAGHGIGRGDRVLIRLGNDERYLAALVGTWLRGASAIAMHPATPVGDAERTVTTMAARVVVGDPADEMISTSASPRK